ncbi:hypothetical protein OG21DRAFT_1523862 [Imleria badia]|nr:hypothetical protein OG21DRAFT_1523862 [Imleria badia]
MPPDRSKLVPCDVCGKQFNTSGLGPHQKLCIKRKWNLEEDLALLGKLQNVNPSEPRLEAAAAPSGLHAAPHVFQGVENTWASEIPVDDIIDVPDNDVIHTLKHLE